MTLIGEDRQMKTMALSKLLSVFLLALSTLCSCAKNNVDGDPLGEKKRISVSLALPKTTLTSDRSHLQWTVGDRIAILNDATVDVTELTYTSGDSRFEVEVPALAKTVTAVYPSSMSSGMVIPESQTQSVAGVLDPGRYPMTAESALEGNAVSLLFSPSCSALALNIYKSSGLVAGETVNAIGVFSRTVTLTTPYVLGSSKPADRKTFPGQLYIIFPRKELTDLKFTIETSIGTRTISAKSGTKIDLSSNDFFVLNIDLAKSEVEIEASTSESFTEDEEILGPQYPDPKTVNIIPDFSSVGYHYGEKEIPTVPVGVNLAAPADGSDATKMIQDAIDACPKGKAVVLGEGTFNVAGVIYIDRSDVVLRGTGINKTIINGTGTVIRDLVVVGKCNRTSSENWLDGADQVHHSFVKYSYPQTPDAVVTDDFVPCGRWFITVDNVSKFAVGDRILVERKATDEWRAHVGPNDLAGSNWSASIMKYKFRRRVTRLDGNKLYLDAPVVFQIESGAGNVYHYTIDSISEVGIENLSFTSEYNPSVTSTMRDGNEGKLDPYPADEQKVFTGINIGSAENCWVRNCEGSHFTQCFVRLDTYALNVTVQDCRSLDPVCKVTGSRRYAFHICGELCLVKDCVCEKDRHAFVVYAWAKGPNAFVNCIAKDNYAELGPHQRLSTAGLYDNVTVDNSASGLTCSMGVLYAGNVNGRAGHGWTGANYVFWNCSSAPTLRFYNQSADGIYNYAVGCIGTKQRLLDQNSRYNDGVFEDGCWWPEAEPNTKVTTNVSLNSVPVGASQKPWWPQVCGNAYPNPMSLYDCQLYDRLNIRGLHLDI